MGAAKIKGSLLEYLVRRMLTNCGFKRVLPDGRYIFSDRGLNFIHGKGAAHDADVLMDPPIQMPFSYPYRINFECKAYKKKTGLPIVRNALGLRYDINEFEILTEEQLILRQNLRRSSLAVSDRVRHNYQIGVASVEDFTKDAFEFAANNKIPLISLRWFLDDTICDLFHDITDDYLNSKFSKPQQDNILLFLKDSGNMSNVYVKYLESHLKTIIDAFELFEKKVLIGLLESGDMVLLLSQQNIDLEYLLETRNLLGKYYYNRFEELDRWDLIINNQINVKFYLPDRIVTLWEREHYDPNIAIDLKEKWFLKMFVFIKFQERSEFKIINMDAEWFGTIQGRR